MVTHHLWGWLMLAFVLASAMPGNLPAPALRGVACVSLLLSCLLFSFFEHTSLKLRGART